jgi:hypothetical protein
MTVAISPADGADPGDGFFVRGLVPGADEVVVKLCNATGGEATPAAATYNVRVLP